MQLSLFGKRCHSAPRLRGALCAFAGVLALVACGSGGSSGPGSSAPKTFTTPAVRVVNLSLSAQVGQKLFFDKNLSASGKLSCASCHDPDRAYGPPNDLAVQLGGPDLLDSGARAVPSLRYNESTPAYADLLDNPDGISAPGPGGGFTWDGRANTLAEQARAPLLSSVEMANASIAEVVAKLMRASYAALFQQAFGNQAFDDPDAAFNNALAALQAFQLEDPSFHPYSSKFDLHAGNKIGGTLTAAETRGMRVFTDPNKGNCSSCHFQGAGLNGSSGLFTDFSYEAIGVPRNAAIPANSRASYYDLGVCGPLRSDHLARARGAANPFCGMFKTPTLRNVATRKVFFHNGVMHSLEQAIRFYNTRDTMPQIWYPSVGGTPKANRDPDFPAYGLITTQYVGGRARKFDDLPAAYRVNIDTQMPLDGRRAASAPPLSEQNIADLICFLETLTDGDQAPSSPQTSGSCVD
jgi:cytochrome c peroxidase